MNILTKQALDYLKYCMEKGYVDENDFEKVYGDLLYKSDFIKEYKVNIFSIPRLISTITSLFLEAGIKPLNYLKTVPRCYLYENTEIATFTIPEGVFYIGDYAFCGCINLRSVKLPKSITDIEVNSFKDCTKLTDVIYEGTKEEWNKLQRINRIFTQVVKVERVACSDGVIEIEGNNLNMNIEDID